MTVCVKSFAIRLIFLMYILHILRLIMISIIRMSSKYCESVVNVKLFEWATVVRGLCWLSDLGKLDLVINRVLNVRFRITCAFYHTVVLFPVSQLCLHWKRFLKHQ